MEIADFERAILDAGGDPRIPCAGVYQILNTNNGKCYLGGSVKLRVRMAEHVRMLRRGQHHSIKLQRAWDKYGETAFIVKVLEITSREKVEEAEQHWLDRLQPFTREGGYNVCPQGRIRLGASHSPEVRAKISAALKGRKLSKELVEKMRLRMQGTHRTPETKAKIGVASAQRRHSPEARAKIGAAHRGKIVTDETRNKIGAAHLGNTYWAGKTHTEESKQKMRQATRNRVTEESRESARRALQERWAADDGSYRAKMAAAVSQRHSGKVTSEETKAKMSAGMREAWARRKVQQSPLRTTLDGVDVSEEVLDGRPDSGDC